MIVYVTMDSIENGTLKVKLISLNPEKTFGVLAQR